MPNLLYLGALVLVFVVGGCTSPWSPVTLDGFDGEWSPDTLTGVFDARGDASGPTDVVSIHGRRTADAVYLRLEIAEPANLHKPAEGGGLRLTVETSAETLTLDTGLRQVTRDGLAVPFTEVGYVGLPTHSATAFEIRLRLQPHAGAVDITVDGSDAIDAPLRLSRTERWPAMVKPTVDRGEAPLRVVAWNVLHGGPFSKPEHELAGREVLKTLAADVLLLQEVWRIENLAERVRAICGDEWAVHESGGVAVASKLPMTLLDLAPLSDDLEQRGDSWSVRRNLFVGVDTAIGPVVVVSSHWKCCGSMGSSEDLQRMDDALHALKAVWRLRQGGVEGEWDPQTRSRPIVKAVPQRFRDAPVVIAGDYNLVGSRAPLDMLLTGNFRELVPLQTDERLAATWRSPREERGRPDGWEPGGFPTGRLDLAVVDQALNVRRSFVADLGEPTLLSDHLPIVLDFDE